jgi:cell fate (sporulation/competence/biofilm development) regulator YlbF (YheA/YmcA/DUF963 family)
MDREEKCKHSMIQRKCYACHLEYINSQEKTQLDTLYETISELKIRISKLEEYKRLQVDENRAVSRNFDRLDEKFKALEEFEPIKESYRLKKASDEVKKIMDLFRKWNEI